MANEAVIIELLGIVPGRPFRQGVADATAVPKGTIMEQADDRKVTVSNGDDSFGGIAAHEKVANDGSESLTVYSHGIFDLKNANLATFQAGDHLDVNGANLVTISDAAGVLKPGRFVALENAEKLTFAACLVGSGL